MQEGMVAATSEVSAYFLHFILPTLPPMPLTSRATFPSQLTLWEAPSQTPSEVVSSVILSSVKLAMKVDRPAQRVIGFIDTAML